MVSSRQLHHLALVGSLAGGAAFLAPVAARACGGFVFDQTETVGGMAGQQVFVGFGASETVLVVSPTAADVSGDMAFIIPLAAPPQDVLDGDPLLFRALDSGTAPRFHIEPMVDEPAHCGRDDDSKGGGAVGGSTAGGGGGDDGGGTDVSLYDQGSTATYDYVVVGGDTGTSIAEWLDQEGFAVPPEMQAELDPYVEKGWVFLAATLTAGAERETLAPLQLNLPPGAPELFSIPFAFGAPSVQAGQDMALSLYTVGADAVVPKNYEVVEVPVDDVYAVSRQSTNYWKLFEDATAAEDGAVVIEHAQPGWSPQHLTNWAWEVVDADGWDDPDASIPDQWLNGANVTGNLVRTRTRLNRAQLRDMTFELDPGLEVDLELSLTYDDREDAGCSIPTRTSAPLLLLGVLVLLRRRRPWAMAAAAPR